MKKLLLVLMLIVTACGEPPVEPESECEPETPVAPANELMIVNTNLDHGDEDTLDCDLQKYAVTVGGGGSVSFKMTPSTVNCTWPDGRSFRLVLYSNTTP